MNEMNRLLALLAAHLLGSLDGATEYTLSVEERAEMMALAQLANARGEAARGYHKSTRGQAALAKAVGSPIVVISTQD